MALAESCPQQFSLDGEAAARNPNAPQITDPQNFEGLSLAEEDTLGSGLYAAVDGNLVIKTRKEIRGGTVAIGSFRTRQAEHGIGIYTPEGYDPLAGLPTIPMTTPLATGNKGHSDGVAAEMMRQGFRVVKKGVPRYPGPLTRGVNLTGDANVILSLLDQAQEQGEIDENREIFPYGESQAAMKALGVTALAPEYNFEVVDGLVVAPCYIVRINLLRPDKQVGRMVEMAAGGIRFARQLNWERIRELRGTLSPKDIHHHIIVLPILVSGETGGFLPHISQTQKFELELYGKDGHSHPYQVEDDFKKRFPNVSSRVLPGYGHLDGIMSPETAALRSAKLFEIKQNLNAVN